MADNIVTQDPTKPGVLKGNGPTLASGNKIPLNGLDTTGAANGDVIKLTGGVWAPGTGGASSDTASNLGGGAGVFASKVGADFQFKSLVAGANTSIGTSGTEITITSGVSDILIYEDQKAANTAGGTFTAAAWQTRTLNTEVTDAGGHGSLAANQITLQAGTYEYFISAPAYQTDSHRVKLFNVTDAVDVQLGQTARTSSTVGTITHSTMWGRMVLAAAKVLEIRHFCTTTSATNGFGFPANDGSTEVYTQIFLRKVG